jgi:hypothetical protein
MERRLEPAADRLKPVLHPATSRELANREEGILTP